MLYVNNDGSCSPFNGQKEMIGVIKRDTNKVSTQKQLAIQQVIADAIKERGGKLYEDNGEVMNMYIKTILAILGLERV